MHARLTGTHSRTDPVLDRSSGRPEGAGALDHLLDAESLLSLGHPATARAVFQAYAYKSGRFVCVLIGF